ncbi:MAG: terpene cyclase/mutase family protein [Acidobacteria bacterium]|nr:terpene cyclase/mutase family protein [Acidobacteriota bacterium]
MPFTEGEPKRLLAWQGRDGGWGYLGGGSWTEPTAFALLALSAVGNTGPEWRRGQAWLSNHQRPDGGWPPHPAVTESTGVTCLPLLLPPSQPGWGDSPKAVQWLLAQSGRESGWWYRLRQRLLGVPADRLTGHAGWPFYPGAAAWVAPTALSILALEKCERSHPSPSLRQRLEAGREHLLARRCQDGGWNHGSSRALGYEAGSYPETTGLALLALHGMHDARLTPTLRLAEESYLQCRSMEGLAWLRLALLVHGRSPAPFPSGVRCRTVIELALRIIAEAAASGRNVMVS